MLNAREREAIAELWAECAPSQPEVVSFAGLGLRFSVTRGDVMNEIGYFEIVGPNVEQLAGFYQRVFGWTAAPGPFPPYQLLAGDAGAGLPGGFRQEPVCDRVIYIRVEDLHASLEAAVREGARILIPPLRVPDMGLFATFEDPAGNRTGLVQWSAPPRAVERSAPPPEASPTDGPPRSFDAYARSWSEWRGARDEG